MFLILLIILIFVLFGAYHGFVDPTSRALISDIAGENKKGRAYGLYYLIIGLLTLPESITFGFFYDYFGHGIEFLFSSILLAISMIIFAIKKFQ
ncbi:MAG: hypothetical protein GF329_20930 [Candidatus Lokiarchaeota archaeon]|nr:hypothetical protein [Candidatus Lokiarchaeota archaeon]